MGVICFDGLEGVQESLISLLHSASTIMFDNAPWLVGFQFDGLSSPIQNIEHVITEGMGIELRYDKKGRGRGR